MNVAAIPINSFKPQKIWFWNYKLYHHRVIYIKRYCHFKFLQCI